MRARFAGTTTPGRRESRWTMTMPRSSAASSRSFFSEAWSSIPVSGDFALTTPQGAVHLPSSLALLDVLSPVLVGLAPDQPQLDLGLTRLEVKHERDDGITPFAHPCRPSVKLGAVQQELPGSYRVVGEGGRCPVGRDAQRLQE